MNNPRNWSDDEIREYFDSHPNLRMQHLARMTGKSMSELKRVLMPGRRQATQYIQEVSDFDDDVLRYLGEKIGNRVDHLRQEAREMSRQADRIDRAWGNWDLEDLVAEGALSRKDARTIEKAWELLQEDGSESEQLRNEKAVTQIIRQLRADDHAEGAKRVANRYKEAYKMEQGSGGLLFRFDRDGFFVRTPAQDPHGQVYSASTTMSNSGKTALRNLTKMWNDPKIRREIMSLRKKYDVMEYIDNALKEMGTRVRLRWHSWHSPD